jgi:hypothetical protein
MVSTPSPPDPSPAAWMEYVAAAQRLDTVRRTAASVVAEHNKALQAARDKLSHVREKLAAYTEQTGSLDASRSRPAQFAGAQASPGPADHVDILARLTNASPAQVTVALREAESALDAANAELSVVEDEQPANLARNVGVYTGYTLLITVLQVPLWLALSGADAAAILAMPCGLTLPAIAFGLAWLTIGMVAPGERDRNPLFGAAISLVALLPVLAFVGLEVGRLSG